jgi:O-antigen ligase
LGCILSLSSGPILAFAIIISTYVCDLLLGRYSWRWKLVGAILALFLLVLSIVTERPVSWILSHLTLDASTGYFRLYVFQYIYQQINESPLVGYGFGSIGDDEFLSNVTVDCVWLVNAMRYGFPMVVLFFLANLTAYTSLISSGRRRGTDPFVAKAATGFTLTITAFMLVGITVHFWNATWMFWAVCIGIRGSIKEWQRHGSPVTVNHSRLPLSPPRLAHGWRTRSGRDQRYWPAATPKPDARE